ncbi:response regulator [Treponema sp. OMZ 840]|uniref:response regulator transcription factor n=1 Tax=Treponema sp. OMZ 840 TaxID=244313 RepID=UPI003D8F4893
MYKVLIVEDENIIRKFLLHKTNWIELNCEIVGEAVNGKEGLEKIIELTPDIVITDIRMPLLDGLEMLTKAKQYHCFETIILSAYNDFSYAQKAVQLRAHEYLLKPVNPDQLSKAIRKICKYFENKQIVLTEDVPIGSFSVKKIDELQDNFSLYVKEIYHYIRKNFKNKITLNELSTKYSISTTYLNRILKKETGFPFNDFLNRYRIHISILMLKTETCYIYEIAEKTGFNSYKYFAEVFRKYMDCSPSDFKSKQGVIAAGYNS